MEIEGSLLCSEEAAGEVKMACQLFFHRILHNHVSSGAGAIGPLVAGVPCRLSVAQPQRIKKKHFSMTFDSLMVIYLDIHLVRIKPPLLFRLSPETVNHFTYLARFRGQVISPVRALYLYRTAQRNVDSRLCPEMDSKPRSQSSSSR
jgi:hypothetical protein